MKLKETLMGPAQGERVCLKDSKIDNPSTLDIEGPYKLLLAEQARFGNLAGSAGRSLYHPSMSYVLRFQTKYIWNLVGIPVHPAQLVLLYLSTLLDS